MATATKLMQKTVDGGIAVYNLNSGKWHYCPIVTEQSVTGHYSQADAETAMAELGTVTIDGGAVTRTVATMARVDESDRFIIQSASETIGPWVELTPA